MHGRDRAGVGDDRRAWVRPVRALFLAFGLLFAALPAHAQVTSAICNGVSVPAWVTSQRPTTPAAGAVGFNNTTGYCETFGLLTNTWTPGDSLTLPINAPGPVSLTGPTIETNIAVIRVPAGSVGKNGGINLTCLWSYTNSANNKNLVVRFSNTSGAVTGLLVGNASVVTTTATAQTGHFMRNTGATNVQNVFGAASVGPFTASAVALNTGAVDTIIDSFLNINGILALGSETITLQNCSGSIVKSSP